MDEEERRSIGDYLAGTLEGLGVGVGYVPHALGSAILSGGEGLLSGFDWSDRPSWLFPSYKIEEAGLENSAIPLYQIGGKVTEGYQGVPFWNSGEAKQGFHRGIDRYSAPPQTPEGQDMAEWQNSLLTYADIPWVLFGEGTEELAKRFGVSEEVAGILGDTAYWITSLGTGPIKAGSSVARRGMGVLSDGSRIRREGWYKKIPGFQRNPVSVLNTPVEMSRGKFWQSMSPIEKARYQYFGLSREAQNAIDESMDAIRTGENTKDIRALRRDAISDLSNQYVQKVIYDPNNPAIQPGTPLYEINQKIFPSSVKTSAIDLKNNPDVISEAIGIQINPDVAKHIAPRIPDRFLRINDGKPVVVAHRREGPDVTGNQMGQAAHVYKTNPKQGIGHAWSNLMDDNKKITAESLLAEINRINETGTFDRKSAYPIPRNIKEENGYISYEYQVDAGPDPLTASFDVIGVFNPRTGRIFELSIDRMALGGGLGSAVDAIGEFGSKNHWISVTPFQTSVSRKYLKELGLDDESLIGMGAGTDRGRISANFPKGVFSGEKITPKGRAARGGALSDLGEEMSSLDRTNLPRPPKTEEMVGMMPQNPLPFSLLPTGRPKFGIEHFFPQANYPLVGTGLQERYKRDAY